MLPCDLYEWLRTIFSWTTALRVLFLLLGLFVCARAGTALARCLARHRRPAWPAEAAALAGACLCMAVFARLMVEDYAYTVLGGEDFTSVPQVMGWLVEHGRESRLVRTVRAPDTGNLEKRNVRLYAALVLARKNPVRSRDVLATVPPFEKACTSDPAHLFGTNRYSFPATGPDVLRMQWTTIPNDGRTARPPA